VTGQRIDILRASLCLLSDGHLENVDVQRRPSAVALEGITQ
jgi:hypothetical protein